MHFGPEDAAPRLNVGRVEMHLSGRGTPPSGLYLAERKKPKNLYHLGSKGKEDGEGFLIQGTVTFFVRIPLREKPLRFWSSCQRVFIRLFGIDTIFPLAISLEEKERFLVLWNLFVGITTRSIFTWKLFSSRGRRRNDGYFDKFDIEQCTVKMSMHERTRLLDTIAENTVDTAENFKCAIH